MFNISQKIAPIAQDIIFSVNDELPTRLIQLFAFNYVNITSLDASGNPVIPSDGMYKVYVKSSSVSGFEPTDNDINAVNTGGALMADGFEQSAFYGSVIKEIKIVPVGIIGAVSYMANIRQVDRAQRPSIPNDLYYLSLNGRRRIDVRTLDRAESFMADGVYFTGVTERIAIPAVNTFYSVIAIGTKPLAIEDVIVSSDFANVTSGQLNIRLNVYIEASNGNGWTFTTSGTVLPLGRPVNAAFINNFPLSTIDRGVTPIGLTGNADYILYQVDYFIDTAANRNTKSSDKSQFFAGDRKLFLPANSTALIETISTGNAGGTYDLSTIFFASESEVDA